VEGELSGGLYLGGVWDLDTCLVLVINIVGYIFKNMYLVWVLIIPWGYEDCVFRCEM
jgi:hypothetical protein